MRKVSLLCLLGIIATTSITSVAIAAGDNVEKEVYGEAIETVAEKYKENQGFDIAVFADEIKKITDSGKAVTEIGLLNACQSAYTAGRTDIVEEAKAKKSFCKDFFKEVAAEHEKVRAKMEKLVAATEHFEPIGISKYAAYADEGTKKELYALVNTKYGNAVYTIAKDGKPTGFVCFLGDDGGEACVKRKACTKTDKTDKKGLVFVCGSDSNNYSALTGQNGVFSIFSKKKNVAMYSKFINEAETRDEQLQNIHEIAVNKVYGLSEEKAEEQKQDEKTEEKVEQKQECQGDTKHVSPEAKSCLANGVCEKPDENKCYPTKEADCYEAAGKGDPAIWTGQICSCGNLKIWNDVNKRCEEKLSRRQELVKKGASSQRLACYDAGNDTTWNGDDKSTDETNCVCKDSTKTWDGKVCVNKAEQESKLAYDTCVNYIVRNPNKAKWSDVTNSCECLMQGNVINIWTGEACVPDANNCNVLVEAAKELPENIIVKYISKSSSKYTSYQRQAKIYNNALAMLKASKPEDRKSGACSEMYKRADIDKLLYEIQDKDALIGKLVNKTYDMRYTDGDYKRVAAEDQAYYDATWNFVYLIKNGDQAAAYNNVKTQLDVNQLATAEALFEYLGGDVKCSGTCRTFGDDRVECSVGTVTMKFRYDSICAKDVKPVLHQGADNRTPLKTQSDQNKPVQNLQYNFQYKPQGADRRDA